MFFVRWLPTFLAYPLGALIASSVMGSNRSAAAALGAGAIVGAVVGLAQWLALGRIVDWRWPLVTTAALALGSAAATVIVGAQLTPVPAIIGGAILGLVVGASQGVLVARAVSARRARAVLRIAAIWAGSLSISWAGAWLITATMPAEFARVGVIFGTAGALAATCVTGVVLRVLLRDRMMRPSADGPARSRMTDAAALVISASDDRRD